jgi:hypothetical protein
MQELEHSLGLLFLFYIAKQATRNYTILVPYINYETIDGISTALSEVVSKF